MRCPLSGVLAQPVDAPLTPIGRVLGAGARKFNHASAAKQTK
jgi:hypothetical protein